MLDPNLLRNELDAVAEKLLARRNFKLDVEALRTLEERRKVLQVETENLQAERNPDRKRSGRLNRGEDIEPLRRDVNELGEKLDAAKAELQQVLNHIETISLTIPNMPDDCVPPGKDDSENQEVLRWGEPRQFDFPVRDHMDLGELTGGLSMALG